MKYSIVIVDDHVLIAKALKGIIANFDDFEVWYECENGRDLQNKLAAQNKVPTIVLLDISMPIMDGFSACRILKSTPETCEIPIIFMTSLSDTLDKVNY